MYRRLGIVKHSCVARGGPALVRNKLGRLDRYGPDAFGAYGGDESHLAFASRSLEADGLDWVP
jgi:hypothetical protein